MNRPICPECGSTDIWADMTGEWSAESGRFEADQDEIALYHCNRCDYDNRDIDEFKPMTRERLFYRHFVKRAITYTETNDIYLDAVFYMPLYSDRSVDVQLRITLDTDNNRLFGNATTTDQKSGTDCEAEMTEDDLNMVRHFFLKEAIEYMKFDINADIANPFREIK